MQTQTPLPQPATSSQAFPVAGETDELEQQRYETMLSAPGGFSKLFSGDVWAAGADQNWLGQRMGNLLARKSLPVDDGFEMTPEKWKQATDGIPEPYWERFKDAGSDVSIQAIRSQIAQDLESDRILADAGVAGTIVNGATAVFSPENALITLATLGVGSGASLAKGAFSVRQLVSARGVALGLTNVIPNLATDSVIAADSVHINSRDVFTNATSGFLFGDVANATSGLSRASRFVAGGASQALPATAFGVTNPDSNGLDVTVMAGVGFMFGGVFNAMPPTRSITPLDESMHRLGRDMADRGTIAASVESGAALTPEGAKRQVELDTTIATIAEGHVAATPDPVEVRAAETLAPTTHTVFRGEMQPLSSGKHLSGVMSVDSIANPDTKTPLAPFTFYTTSEADAARYASADKRALASYEAKQPGRGREVFTALHGHEPRDEGAVSSLTVQTRKTLDMTGMGTKADQLRFVELLNDAIGNKPLPEKWKWKDVPDNVNSLVGEDGVLRGAFTIGNPDNDGGSGPVWAYLRNTAGVNDVVLSNPKHPNYRPLSKEKTIGSDFATFLKERGYDSVAYMHDTPEGPTKHIAVLQGDAKPAAATGGTAMGVGAASRTEIAAQAAQDAILEPVAGWKPGDPYAGNVTPGGFTWGVLGSLPENVKTLGGFAPDLPNKAARLASWSSQGGVVANNPDPMFSTIGKMLGTFGLSKEPSLNLQKKAFNDARTAAFNVDMDAAYKAHQQQASAAGSKPYSDSEFYRNVGLALREAKRNNLTNSPFANDPGVMAGVEAYNKAARTLWESAKRFDPNVADFKPNQMSRVWNGEALDRARFASDGGESLGYITQLIEEATYREILPGIKEAHAKLAGLFPDMSELEAIDKAKSVAKNLADRIIKNAGRNNDSFNNADIAAFGMDARERVKAAIKEVFGDRIKGGDIDNVLFKVGPSEKETGPSFLRDVQPLDETHSITVPVTYGDRPGTYVTPGTTRTYRVSDFLENDVRLVHQRLLAQVEAHTHFREFVRVLRARFGLPESVNTPQDVIAYLERQVMEGNPDLRDRDLGDLASIDTLLRQLTNRPIYEFKPGKLKSTFMALDNLRRVSSATAMGTPGAGVQQMTQMADVLAENSLSLLRKLPDFHNYLSGKAKGNKSSRLEMQWGHEMGFGVGVPNARAMPEAFTDDAQFTRSLAERGVRTWQRWMYKVSGQMHIQQAIEGMAIAGERITAHEQIMDGKFAKFAGTTAEEAANIEAQYKKHHIVHKEAGHEFIDPNLGSWDSPRAAAIYQKALLQRASRTSMFIDPSANATLFKTPLGRFLGSLMTFATNAWDKRLLYHYDQFYNRSSGFSITPALSMLTTAALASALYALRTEVMAFGRPDREKYLRERLSWSEIGKAGFSKATWSSIVPTVGGYAFQAGGQRDPFSYARVTQLSQGIGPGQIIDRTPFGNWSRAAIQTAALPARVLDPQWHMNKRDIENALDTFAVPNALNLRNALKWLYDDLPKGQPLLDNEGSGGFR